MTELICITCPKGCHLRVDEEKGFAVTGNSCPRGAEYGRNELQHPVRTVTSTVRIQGADLPRLPVKTDRPLAKEKYSTAWHCSTPSQPMHRCMWEMYWRLIFWVQM